ncbi:MAG: hypothetical protein OXR73_27345 [Myxococcales bacterium]|nr:hypothetical protein [Myxococcales bacterium]
MLLPHIGPVTPHTRLCGAGFLILMWVIPLLHYASVLAAADSFGVGAAVGVFVGYIALVLSRWARRTTSRVANVSLLTALGAGLLVYGLQHPIKRALADGVGLFDGRKPSAEALPEHAQRFKHPEGAFQMLVPRTWKRVDVELGLSAFTRRGRRGPVAEVRPHCYRSDVPLSVEVFDALQQYPDTECTCYREAGMKACLLKRSAAGTAGKGARWTWLARPLDRPYGLSLTFLVEGASTAFEQDVLDMIDTITVAPVSGTGPLCPTPLAWAGFSTRDGAPIFPISVRP